MPHAATKTPCSQINKQTNAKRTKYGVKSQSVSCSVASDSLWPHGLSPPGSSVHGIHQTRILEWVAIPVSRGSSQSRDQIWVSCIAGRFFIAESLGKSNVITGVFILTRGRRSEAMWWWKMGEKGTWRYYTAAFEDGGRGRIKGYKKCISRTWKSRGSMFSSRASRDIKHRPTNTLVSGQWNPAVKLKDACSLEEKLWWT